MTKKIYLRPETQTFCIQYQEQILNGSVTNVTTTGLDGDYLSTGDNTDEDGNSMWDDAF